MQLKNKCAIITGANQGLGFEIAKQFVKEGANIVVCARNASLLKEAHKTLTELANNKSKVIAKVTDISKPEQVRILINETVQELGQLDILVANAGVYGPKGAIEDLNWEEWSEAIDINLKGTVLLCKYSIPHMKKQKSGKIIIISGGGATKPLPFLSAYAASKAGVVRFAETLAEEVANHHIEVNSVAPGALNTRLLEEVLAAGPEKVGKTFYEQSLKQKASGGTSLEIGASLCVFLASAESNGITGKLISAVWDPWKKMPQYADDLKTSDIYTLRRIVPQDRGKAWEEA